MSIIRALRSLVCLALVALAATACSGSSSPKDVSSSGGTTSPAASPSSSTAGSVGTTDPATSDTSNSAAPSGSASSGTTAKFEVDGFDITFDYPADFNLGDVPGGQKQAGSNSAAKKYIYLDNENGIQIQRYNLRASITASNIDAVKDQVDNVVAQLDPSAASGNRVDVGGLPGYAYDLSLGNSRTAHYVVLFKESTEYVIDCEATSAKKGQIDAGCSLVLSTLQPR